MKLRQKCLFIFVTLVLVLFIVWLILSGNIILVYNYWKKLYICDSSDFNYKERDQYFGNLSSTVIIPATTIDMRNMSCKLKLPGDTDKKLQTTIVTTYINLGRFRKTHEKFYDTNLYHQWASVFKYILNPMVVYTDSDEFAELIYELRKPLGPKTVILKINKWNLWAFKFYGEICRIFKQVKYPIYTLNTERPDYSCAMHSKIVLMGDAIRRNLFHTDFFQWLDIGLFRDIIFEKEYFLMKLPKHFDPTKIAFTRTYDSPSDWDPEFIIKENKVWYGGATFLGKSDVLLKFEQLYKRAVEYFISKDLINTDQQIIYAIYSDAGRKIFIPDVEIQPFVPEIDSTTNRWFYLGYICREIVI